MLINHMDIIIKAQTKEPHAKAYKTHQKDQKFLPQKKRM